MASFSIALSGLDASSQELNVIANNLSNLNTPGYKTQSADFGTLFYQTLGESGNGDPLQVGGGTQIGSINTSFTNGSVSATGVDSNAALQGNGFFIVQGNGDQVGQNVMTRDGSFTVGSDGLLETANGQGVLGYAAVNGAVNANSPLTTLQVGNLASPAVATSNLSMQANLQSGSANGTTYAVPVQVYDSLGASHTLTATFTCSGSNTWSYNVTLPGADTGASSPTTLATGTLSFDSSGALTSASQAPVTLTSGALSDGAAALKIKWSLAGASGSSLITQTAADSATQTTQQDGVTVGNLTSFTVNPDGSIAGSFSNGVTQSIGQLAVGDVANEQGLQNIGNNDYAATASSGALITGVAGEGGLGTISGASIEQSNVDIAGQFTDLIQAQNAYEANAHAVTTLDQIMQATMAMQTNG